MIRWVPLHRWAPWQVILAGAAASVVLLAIGGGLQLYFRFL